ncbi:MAG: aminotransferase [Candidatus Competibacterales bacterium]
MKSVNPVFAQGETTVFEVMTRLAKQFDAVNLGQGFPDDPGPEVVRRAAAAAVVDGWNQYPPMLGLPALRRAVADHDRRFYDLAIDPEGGVLVTTGATEALAACLLAFLNPGDEVVLFEPLYDAYLPMVRRAGGVPRCVTLSPPHWRLAPADLEALVSPKVKAVLLNNPHNPTAKVFTRDELALVADFVRACDAVAICDEVYEHLVFDDARHTPLMTLPGMAERCLKIGSAGKTFSLTGWKVGYISAVPQLLAPVIRAHQYLVFTVPPHLQSAVATGLDQGDEYFAQLVDTMVARRDHLDRGLRSCGLAPLPSFGTYFINVQLPDGETDVAFCQRLVEEAQVAAIPVSAFYDQRPRLDVVRFCFAKAFEVLDEALARLTAWRHRA